MITQACPDLVSSSLVSLNEAGLFPKIKLAFKEQSFVTIKDSLNKQTTTRPCPTGLGNSSQNADPTEFEHRWCPSHRFPSGACLEGSSPTAGSGQCSVCHATIFKGPQKPNP